MSHLNVHVPQHFHAHPRTDFSLVLVGSYVVGYAAGKLIGVLWTHGPATEQGVRRLAGGAAEVAHLAPAPAPALAPRPARDSRAA